MKARQQQQQRFTTIGTSSTQRYTDTDVAMTMCREAREKEAKCDGEGHSGVPRQTYTCVYKSTHSGHTKNGRKNCKTDMKERETERERERARVGSD